MTEYHTVYKEPEGTTTEWEDLQVKFGNWEKREKPKIEAWQPAEEERKGGEKMEGRSAEELEEMEEEFDDDGFMEEYRQKRIAELKAAASRPRFGSVELIKSGDFVREVSSAPADVWVVLHLFKDSTPACSILHSRLSELAVKFPGTKFLRMISTDCIKDYPDFNLPTLLVYNGGQVKATLVGMSSLGGMRCTAEDVAFILLKAGPVLESPDGSTESVIEGLGRDYMKKLVARREDANVDDED